MSTYNYSFNDIIPVNFQHELNYLGNHEYEPLHYVCLRYQDWVPPNVGNFDIQYGLTINNNVLSLVGSNYPVPNRDSWSTNDNGHISPYLADYSISLEGDYATWLIIEKTANVFTFNIKAKQNTPTIVGPLTGRLKITSNNDSSKYFYIKNKLYIYPSGVDPGAPQLKFDANDASANTTNIC